MAIWTGLIGAYVGGYLAALIGRALNRSEGTVIAVVCTLGGMLGVVGAWRLVASVSGFGARVNGDHILVLATQNSGVAFAAGAALVLAVALPFILVARPADATPVFGGGPTPTAPRGPAKPGKDQAAGRTEPTI